jgi:hypothetical protein
VFVALVIQQAMRCVVLPSVVCPALPYVSTLSHKLYDFQKKNVIGHKMPFDLL